MLCMYIYIYIHYMYILLLRIVWVYTLSPGGEPRMYTVYTITLCMYVCMYAYIYFCFFFDPEGLPYKFLVFAPEVDR